MKPQGAALPPHGKRTLAFSTRLLCGLIRAGNLLKDSISLSAAASLGPLSSVPPASEGTKIPIVPSRELPIIAVDRAFIVYAIASNNKWALTICHVVGSRPWTGIDLFVGLVLRSILGRLSLPARAELSARFTPKIVILMPTVVTMNLAAGFQIVRNLGNLSASSPNHVWLIASFCVAGVMVMIALGIFESANIAVLSEMTNKVSNGEQIHLLMNRFISTAGILGAKQIATLMIKKRVASR